MCLRRHEDVEEEEEIDSPWRNRPIHQLSVEDGDSALIFTLIVCSDEICGYLWSQSHSELTHIGQAG